MEEKVKISKQKLTDSYQNTLHRIVTIVEILNEKKLLSLSGVRLHSINPLENRYVPMSANFINRPNSESHQTELTALQSHYNRDTDNATRHYTRALSPKRCLLSLKSSKWSRWISVCSHNCFYFLAALKNAVAVS